MGKDVISQANRRRYHKDLYNILGFSPPIDGTLGIATMTWHLDLCALEEKLHARGDYDENESIEDYVLRIFGTRAVQLIKALI